MNKNARKLIPAVAMLLVSASMLSTASYAWFSMNNKVTAGGMNVNAIAPGNLEISNNAADKKYANTATSTDSTKAALAAVSSSDGFNFYMAKPSTISEAGRVISTSEVSKLKDANTVVVNAAEVELPTYYSTTGVVGYVDHVFNLRSTATIDQYVTIDSTATKIVITGDNGDIAQAIRFAVLDGEGTTAKAPDLADTGDTAGGINGVVYTQGDAYNTTGKAWNKTQTAAAEGTTIVEAEGVVDAFETDADKYLFKLTKDVVQTVTIRIWLEGESTKCVKDNINSADISVTVVFAITEYKPTLPAA